MGRRSKAVEQVDRLIGKNIRLQRLIKEMSRGELSGVIGVSEQQLRKYETGANRVSASRLFRICRVLGVDVGSVFDGIEGIEHTMPAEENR